MPTPANVHLYVSSSVDGLITQYRLDETSGALSRVAAVSAGEQPSPMALSPDRSTLYVALRGSEVKSVAFAIDSATGQLSPVGEAPLPANMAYLATDREGQWLYGASYGGDLISVQRIGTDRQVEPELVQVLQAGLHVHSVRSDPSNRFVYAAVLGLDQVLQYRIDASSGQLLPIAGGVINAPPHSGPRHLGFAPNGRFLYVLGEKDGFVSSYAIHPDSGALSPVAHVAGIPERLGLAHGVVRDARNNDGKDDPTPRIWAADLKVSADGTRVFTSERTRSSVSVFAADPDTGSLSLLGNYQVEEKQPRNIALSPGGRWLLVSGELSAVLGCYAIDADHGSLSRTSEAPAGANAVWIEVCTAN